MLWIRSSSEWIYELNNSFTTRLVTVVLGTSIASVGFGITCVCRFLYLRVVDVLRVWSNGTIQAGRWHVSLIIGSRIIVVMALQ